MEHASKTGGRIKALRAKSPQTPGKEGIKRLHAKSQNSGNIKSLRAKRGM